MSLQQLNTRNVAKDVTDRLDQMRNLDIFPNSIIDKLDSKAKLIRAINEGDIEACGYLEPVSQFMVYVPEGNTEVYLRNSDSYKDIFSDAINNNTNLTDAQKSIILELQPWTKVGKLKSTTLYSHSDIPYPDRPESGEKFKIVTYHDFKNSRPDRYTSCSKAIYHPAEERIVFDRPMTGSRFITFQATVLPEKVDVTQVEDWPDYSISCPLEGERLLILCTLKEIMPVISPLVDKFEAQIYREKRKVVSRMPKEVGSFQVKPVF